MPGIDPDFMFHKLPILPQAKPVTQRKRKLREERRVAVKQEVNHLLKADFIRPIKYTTRITNVVMVKKCNGKWRMCVDYTNRHIPKTPTCYQI